MEVNVVLLIWIEIWNLVRFQWKHPLFTRGNLNVSIDSVHLIWCSSRRPQLLRLQKTICTSLIPACTCPRRRRDHRYLYLIPGHLTEWANDKSYLQWHRMNSGRCNKNQWNMKNISWMLNDWNNLELKKLGRVNSMCCSHN